MSFLTKLPLAASLGCLALAAPAWGQKLDKEEKKWLEAVRPIMLPDEEKAFKELKEKADRAEFRKIFWARRNPKDPAAPDNTFKEEFEQARAEADTKLTTGGRPGSSTDCGRVYLLLGPPDEVKKDGGPETPGRRGPETWVYSKDRPHVKFTSGAAEFSFDAECQLPQGARMGEQLNRVAQNRIAHPNIGYPKGSDNRLVKLADQLPKPTPVRALLKEPRQDFTLSAQPKMLLRSPGGEATYVAGLVKGVVPGAVTEEAGGNRALRVIVATEATDESGNVSVSPDREVMVELAPDGSFVVSYGIALKPGRYTLRVAALEPKSGKGSVTTAPLEVTDFGTDELSMSPLLALKDIQEGQTASPQDPFADFALGTTRLVPRYDNVFSTSETLTLLGVVYNAQRDANGKPSMTASFLISHDGKPVAKAEDQTYDAEMATPSVGPVPLTKYAPGKHTAQLKVKDNVAGKEFVQEVSFEIAP